MTNERRYSEQEIAEILDRATAQDSQERPASAGSGLTLAQLQEIGSEVGIPGSRITEAARAIDSKGAGAVTRTFLGAQRSVSRTVLIDRALTDDEWTRLVVDLRETFEATGKVASNGPLRSWSNGNLQVHVEPEGDRYRVRMRTFKGNIGPLTAMSLVFTLMAALFLVLVLLGEGNPKALVFAGGFGLVGLGQLGFARATLPAWAEERASQMEGLAERIPRLLQGSEEA